MDKCLLIRVWLMDSRYHGEGDWPPSPARLFQALVAGNARGAHLPAECAAALRWLESLPHAPEIRAQPGVLGLAHTNFVPNNDLDAKGGDPRQVANIRSAKIIQPRHLETQEPILYGWRFHMNEQAEPMVRQVCEMANQLYQLGRGVDMAWAQAEWVDAEQGKQMLDDAPGETFRPGEGSGDFALACPQTGSLDSLLLRYAAHLDRFNAVREGKKVKVYFANPPKPRFRMAIYNPTHQWRLFELFARNNPKRWYPWAQSRAAALAEQARDALAECLSKAMPDQTTIIDRLLVGRDAGPEDKAKRVQLIPLPSIGHVQTNRSIRRILLRVPADCSLRLDDLAWGLSGLQIADDDGTQVMLTPATDPKMLNHYAVESGERFCLWRSVTPLALPQTAARRRIDPNRREQEAKGGRERLAEESAARNAVLQALRHVGLNQRTESIRVQREPFSARGERAETFAHGRFNKERLWHAEIRFAKPLEGPLLLGDGRYLGLGLIQPVRENNGLMCFEITQGLSQPVHSEQLAQALRRACMARVQHRIGANKPLPSFFTGHNPDGSPLRAGSHCHLAFIADPARTRLLVVAPHLLEGRQPTQEEKTHWGLLYKALQNISVLYAGQAGRLQMRLRYLDTDNDPLFQAQVWESVNDYRPTRHAKRVLPEETIQQNVLTELDRQGLKALQIDVLSVKQGPRGGLSAKVRITLSHVFPGPLVLGRSRHLGGGLFRKSLQDWAA